MTSVVADEMQRIEAIVEDISKLRSSYEECQKELNLKSKSTNIISPQVENEQILNTQRLLQNERDKNKILLKEIQKYKISNLSIEDLENQIIDYKKLLEIKENENNTLENEISNKKCKPKLIVKKPENTNIFPKLIMKNEYEQQVLKKEISKEIIKEFKARTFRLKQESDIYDSIDGKVIDNWEDTTSFTSNIWTANWIKITGYFIDKSWLKAKKDLWIPKDRVQKR